MGSLSRTWLKRLSSSSSKAHGILVPWLGIEPTSPAVEAQSPHYWTAREAPLTSFFPFSMPFSTEQVNSFFKKNCVSDPIFHFLKALHNFELVWRLKIKLVMRNWVALPSSPTFSLPYSPHSWHQPFPLFLHVHLCPVSGPLHLTLFLTIILFVHSPPIPVWFSFFMPQLKSHLWVNFISIKKKIESISWEFPGGLVVRIPGFHSVTWVQSLVEELRSHKLVSVATKKPVSQKGLP